MYQLLLSGASACARAVDGRTVLHIACANNNPKLALLLILNGAAVDMADEVVMECGNVLMCVVDIAVDTVVLRGARKFP